ncbi:MAG: DUF3592 domain-containing protein [Deltaproteobacteria bacterium]|nr:DUF3592 domain-containing protein [Deltaproteobacteria bacterium]
MQTTSRGIFSYLLLFVAFLGLIFLGVGGLSLWEEISSAKWPSVGGIVIQSEIKRWPRKKSDYDYRAQFLYQYQVEQRTYASDRISTDRNRFKSKMAGEEALAEYPVGKAVVVFYNPDHPEKALLKTGLRFGTLAKTCLGAFLFLGGIAFSRIIKRL